MRAKAFHCQYCSGHHTAEDACVRYRHAVARNECDYCHEHDGRHLVDCIKIRPVSPEVQP